MSDDLPAIAKPTKYKRLARIRDSHRMVARMIALGLKGTEIAQRLGYHANTVTRLQADPAFQELVAQYRQGIDETFYAGADEYFDLLRKNSIAAERMLSDRLALAEEDEDLPSTRELVSISRDGADRIGYGKRSTQTNINLDFAARLDKAIARTKSVGQASSASLGKEEFAIPQLAPPATLVPGGEHRVAPPTELELAPAQAPLRRKLL